MSTTSSSVDLPHSGASAGSRHPADEHRRVSASCSTVPRWRGLRGLIGLCVLASAATAAAGGETRLDGTAIERLLPTIIATSKTTTQTFEADGRTDYHDGRATVGTWEVRGNQYCSNWGGSGPGSWTCYRVYLGGEAPDQRLVWVDEAGRRYVNQVSPR